MPESVTRYHPLEECVSSDLESIIELFTKGGSLDALEIDSRLFTSLEIIEDTNRFAKGVLLLFDTDEQEAAQTAQRAFFFAHKVAEISGIHNFEIHLPLPTDTSLNESEKRLYISGVEGYLSENPGIDGLIRAFADELDVSEDGRFENVARIVSGLIFLLADQSMEMHYFAETAAELDYILSQTEIE